MRADPMTTWQGECGHLWRYRGEPNDCPVCNEMAGLRIFAEQEHARAAGVSVSEDAGLREAFEDAARWRHTSDEDGHVETMDRCGHYACCDAVAALRSTPAAPRCDLACGHHGDHWLADGEDVASGEPWYSVASSVDRLAEALESVHTQAGAYRASYVEEAAAILAALRSEDAAPQPAECHKGCDLCRVLNETDAAHLSPADAPAPQSLRDALEQARDRLEGIFEAVKPLDDLTSDDLHSIAQDAWFGMEEARAALDAPALTVEAMEAEAGRLLVQSARVRASRLEPDDAHELRHLWAAINAGNSDPCGENGATCHLDVEAIARWTEQYPKVMGLRALGEGAGE
jgi:ferredoxin